MQPKANPVEVEIAWPDRDPKPARTLRPESPGPFTFPPVAALIPAGARLTLALLEHLVREAGGELAACDTDGALIVASRSAGLLACPGGAEKLPDGSPAIRALSFLDVDRIRQRFVPLNCTAPGGNPWQVEHNTMTDPLFAYVIGTKRYVLFRKLAEGFEIVKGLEHALGGIYLDPTADDPERPRRRLDGRLEWTEGIWQSVLRAVENGEQPVFEERMYRTALSKFTVSSPAMLGWYGDTAKRPSATSMRPFNFGMAAHPDPMSTRRDVVAISGYERDPKKWDGLSYVDRRTGSPIERTTEPRDTGGFVAHPDEQPLRFRSVADFARQWLRLDDPTRTAPQQDWSLRRGVLR